MAVEVRDRPVPTDLFGEHYEKSFCTFCVDPSLIWLPRSHNGVGASFPLMIKAVLTAISRAGRITSALTIKGTAAAWKSGCNRFITATVFGADTPYRDVASNGSGGGNLDRDWRQEQDTDRDWDQSRRADWDRYRDRDRAYWQQNQRLSGEDQGRFDSYFQRWQNYRRTNNRDEVASMEKRMFDVYDHYGIPHYVRFERVASQGGR